MLLFTSNNCEIKGEPSFKRAFLYYDKGCCMGQVIDKSIISVYL